MPNQAPDNSAERFRVGAIPNEPTNVSIMREAFAALDRMIVANGASAEGKRFEDSELARHSARAREQLDDASYHALKAAFISAAESK